MKIKFCVFLFCAFGLNSFSQPQWKFHIAFEDASGAKDTIWAIFDSTAHDGLPVDTALGEGKIQFDYTKFNVFISNENGDSTKTKALPFTQFNSIDFSINGFNVQLPLILRWDTNLFHPPLVPIGPPYHCDAFLQNDYFFFQSNDLSNHAYNMLLDDSAYAPTFTWFSQSHFPMYFYFMDDPTLGFNEIKPENSIVCFPKYFENSINIKSENAIQFITIYNLANQIVYNASHFLNTNEITIPLNNLLSGIYIVKIVDNLNLIHYEKIIKS